MTIDVEEMSDTFYSYSANDSNGTDRVAYHVDMGDIIYIINNTNSTSKVELYQVPVYLVIFLSICYGTISLLATAGNALVVWVIVGSKRMRNVTNYYIANLALADFLLAIFAIPFEVSHLNFYYCFFLHHIEGIH